MNNTIKMVKGADLTNHFISSHATTRALLGKVHASLPTREFDQSWKGGTGYMDGLSKQFDFDCGTGFASVDDNGRRVVVLPGDSGPMVFFDRFGDMSGPVVCNGHTADLAPSWVTYGNSLSGWCVDNDQFAEQLLRRAA